MIPHNRITVPLAGANAVMGALTDAHLADGSRMEPMESAVADAIGRRFGIATTSGSSALVLLLQGIGVKKGEEVILPAFVCRCLADAVESIGARPVLADIDHETLCLSAETVERKTHLASRAVVAVHLFGAIAPVAGLRRFGLPVIEDCTHGFGLPGMGDKGDMAFLSTYATKFLGGTRGGVAALDDGMLAHALGLMRGKQCPDDLSPSLVMANLDQLQETIGRRRQIAEAYSAAFAGLAADGRLQILAAGRPGVWYRYLVAIPGTDASWLIDQLRRRGVQACRPVEDGRDIPDDCPVARRVAHTAVSLPCYPSLTGTEQAAVIDAVQSVFAGELL